MSIIFDEHMEYAIDCLQSHFAAEVAIRFRKPPFLDIMPEDVDVLTVNGFDNPWKYHEKVAIDCGYLYYNFIEMLHSLDKKLIPGLFDQVYSFFPPSPSSFRFRPYPVKGNNLSDWNTRCMFEVIGWHDERAGKEDDEDDEDEPGFGDPESDPVENDGDEDSGLRLPHAVEDKLYAAIWPYAQVVINNLAMLHRNLRLIAMETYQGHSPGIPANKDFISGLKLPAIIDITDGPVEASHHVIGIPFPSKS